MKYKACRMTNIIINAHEARARKRSNKICLNQIKNASFFFFFFFFFFRARASCVLRMRYSIYPYCSRVLFLSGGRPCYGQKSLNREVHVRCLSPYCFPTPPLLWNAIFDSLHFFFIFFILFLLFIYLFIYLFVS